MPPRVVVQWTAAVSTVWVCPAGVTSVDVVCRGAGGKGADRTTAGDAGGGGGGAYAATTGVPVTPGTSYPVVVGAGGSSTRTSFGTTLVIADHGVSGSTDTWWGNAGGTVANSIGAVRHAGGHGSNGPGGAGGGGGGEGAGSTAAGGNAGGLPPGSATTVGGTGTDGGDGGSGAAVINSHGHPGFAPGGGGGGAWRGSGTWLGGAGGAGFLSITYDAPPASSTVSDGQDMAAAAYNALRSDGLDAASGHDHSGQPGWGRRVQSDEHLAFIFFEEDLL